MMAALVDLRKEIQVVVQKACGGDDLFDVSKRAGEGYTGQRPRLLVISYFVMNAKLLEVMRAFFRENSVAYWPFYCASGPFGSKVSSLSVKTTTSESGGDPLPWTDWLFRAIKVIQPRDIMLIGKFSQIKEFPSRPENDRVTRGRKYDPFVFGDLPRYDKENEDYMQFVDRWSRAFRVDWFGKITPHLEEQYFTGAPMLSGTKTVNAFAVLTGSKRAAPGGSKEKKESKLARVE